MELLAAMANKRPLSKLREHVEKAKQLKNEGNEFYRKFLEEYKKPTEQRNVKELESLQKNAKRAYHLGRLEAQAAYPFNQGENQAGGESSASNEENALKKEWSDVLASIYNNLAATILAYPEAQKTSDFERASEFCSNVLSLQKNNAKAMYRKAQALERTGHLRRALTWLRDADAAENHQNSAVRRDLIRLQTHLEEGKKKANTEFKENFQRGIMKSGISVSSDAVEYAERKKKPKNGRTKQSHAESPSRGSSSSPSSSSDSERSSSSGRSSDE